MEMIEKEAKRCERVSLEIGDVISDIHYIVIESSIPEIEVDQNIMLEYDPERTKPFLLITYREENNHINNICRYYETTEEIRGALKEVKLRRDKDWATDVIAKMKKRISKLELEYLDR